jgi:hypothetical protein
MRSHVAGTCNHIVLAKQVLSHARWVALRSCESHNSHVSTRTHSHSHTHTHTHTHTHAHTLTHTDTHTHTHTHTSLALQRVSELEKKEGEEAAEFKQTTVDLAQVLIDTARLRSGFALKDQVRIMPTIPCPPIPSHPLSHSCRSLVHSTC